MDHSAHNMMSSASPSSKHSMPGMDHDMPAMCQMNVCQSLLEGDDSPLTSTINSQSTSQTTGSETLKTKILTLFTLDTSRLKRAITYAALVGYSYMLMLVFMTYNGWVMLSVAVGAGIGNYLFNTAFNDSMACH
ncbi:hypothetical protein WICPIJ_005138 [Wickerhamomyces pijperi]|uniref:Copper transport protein n=1 Tax=Wickerhamomyces pijperi TaxID=599730 RepID=A0A9P8Q450_WICPI|nr:hypothetical protein WICPIJ_005138 [Wickerhamomyces pijperi]